MVKKLRNWLLRKLMGDFEWSFFKANPKCITEHIKFSELGAGLDVPVYQVTENTHRFISMFAYHGWYNTTEGMQNVWVVNRSHFRMVIKDNGSSN